MRYAMFEQTKNLQYKTKAYGLVSNVRLAKRFLPYNERQIQH